MRCLYDETRGLRLKAVEPVIDEAPWHERARTTRRTNHDLVGARIAWDEVELRMAVKKAGGTWRARQKLWEMPWNASRTLGIGHHVVTA